MMNDNSFVQAALIGYQQRRDQIEEKIQELRRALGGKTAAAQPTASAGVVTPGKRVMSAAARARIGAAQRKRWAAAKSTKAPAKQKRKLSAAGRKRIIEATKKRWAEFRAKQSGAA